MEEKDCWNKFVVSGRVDDYLEYRSSLGYAAQNRSTGTGAATSGTGTDVNADCPDRGHNMYSKQLLDREGTG